MIPGESPKRIEDDHMARYTFSLPYIKGKRVLDIACGVGYGSSLMATNGASEVHGVDILPSNVEYASKRYGTDSLDFIAGDINTYKGSAAYEVITCFETIEHVPDHRTALANLFRLIAPGGTLLISSPNRPVTSPRAKRIDDKPSNAFHVREFTVSELSDALEAEGFVVDGAFGQRQRWHSSMKPLRKIHSLLRKPDERSSSSVTRIRNLTPRYFLLAAVRTA